MWQNKARHDEKLRGEGWLGEGLGTTHVAKEEDAEWHEMWG
jgi:hypothetical protein